MELPPPNRTRSHAWLDRRSLALDQAIARKLRAQPELLQCARNILQRWVRQRYLAVPAPLREWGEILNGWPFEKILALLMSPEKEPARLRQSSPFCGILTREEKTEIFQKYESLRAGIYY